MNTINTLISRLLTRVRAPFWLWRLTFGEAGMARFISAGVAELTYVPAVADPLAPTAAELNGGTDLTGFLTDGGLRTPLDGSVVDSADMSSRFNQTIEGTFGGQPLNAELFNDSVQANDTAFTTLARGTTGFFAIARRGLATPGTWAIGDFVDLWPIGVITRNHADTARNEAKRFTAECSVPGVPLEDFAIAA